MFGILFFGKIIFPKKFPKSFSCRFCKKAVSLQQNLKMRYYESKTLDIH